MGLLARREDKLAALADEIQAAGGKAAWARADVLDTDELHGACDRLEAELGRPAVDVMIANAGYGRPEPPHKFRPGAAVAMYDTNVNGMLRPSTGRCRASSPAAPATWSGSPRSPPTSACPTRPPTAARRRRCGCTCKACGSRWPATASR